jgi:hypothetical protein
MNIYFSNFSNVDLKNETSEGADFTLVEEMRNEYLKKFDQMSRSYQSEENELFNEDYIMDSAFSSFPQRSKTDNPRRLNEEIQIVNMLGQQQFGNSNPYSQLSYGQHQQFVQHPQFGQHYNPMNPMISEEEEFEHMIHHGINNILEHHSSHSAEHKPVSTYNSSVNSLERINPSLKIKEPESSSTPTLRFELRKDLKIRHIYNLFSNFGNLSFISKKGGRVYIKFRTLEFAAIARTYLN